jgi:hypothetical protein
VAAGDAPDYVVHANCKLGAQRVDVVQKLPAGEGRHHVPPIEGKTSAIVRTGGYGDALWASSILPALKDEGYHVTHLPRGDGRGGAAPRSAHRPHHRHRRPAPAAR